MPKILTHVDFHQNTTDLCPGVLPVVCVSVSESPAYTFLGWRRGGVVVYPGQTGPRSRLDLIKTLQDGPYWSPSTTSVTPTSPGKCVSYESTLRLHSVSGGISCRSSYFPWVVLNPESHRDTICRQRYPKPMKRQVGKSTEKSSDKKSPRLGTEGPGSV